MFKFWTLWITWNIVNEGCFSQYCIHPRDSRLFSLWCIYQDHQSSRNPNIWIKERCPWNLDRHLYQNSLILSSYVCCGTVFPCVMPCPRQSPASLTFVLAKPSPAGSHYRFLCLVSLGFVSGWSLILPHICSLINDTLDSF